LNNVWKDFSLKERLSIWCPCGYYVEGFKSRAAAILSLQTHVEEFHADILPFGITTKEALALLRIEYIKKKEKTKIETVGSTDLLVQ
jgi:hypothetical protein